MQFPSSFTWGAASASYQIEGAIAADGKGRSVWDLLTHQPGRIWSDQTGDIACDHYHRFAEDVQLMADLGLQAYRFSIAWTRILPEGTGQVNPQGLAFYDRLVDLLLSHQIQPWVTLFHWDMPYELYAKGGWLNRDSADWFAEYVAVVCDRLSDRVQHWITLNEPQCFVGLGHLTGDHAPGLKLGFSDILRISHHVLLGHGKAVQAIRATAQRSPTVGVAVYGVIKVPASERAEDVQAAYTGMAAVTEKTGWQNTWFADPMLKGAYPSDGLELFREELPPMQANDLATIAQPLDFLGLNIYSGQIVRAVEPQEQEVASVPSIPSLPYEVVPYPINTSMTSMDWAVLPSSMYWGTRFFYERYQLPLVITENGMPNLDWIHLDGQVLDPQRIDFHRRYLQELQRAIASGTVVEGYFVWSFTDNFEWAYGFKQRFGLVYVDYETQARIPKASAKWYQAVIGGNGEGVEIQNAKLEIQNG
jgi:beta-glucosidase